MSEKRCYLCGGKLVNGCCQDCGLDNAKNENKGYRINQSRAEYEKKSRQETKDFWNKKEKSVIDGSNRNDENVKPDSETIPKVRKKNISTVSSANKYKIIVAIIGAIVVLAGPVSGFIKERKSEVASVFENDEEQLIESDPYEYAAYDLASDGDYFGTELKPGEYKVGLHVPEGNYQVSMVDGSGTVTVDDPENSIYLWQSMGKDTENEELEEWMDVRLYQGAKLEVRGNLQVQLETESAQSEKMVSKQENPVSETILLKKGKELVAGVDFPEGVYDLKGASDWTNVVYQIPLYTDYEDEELNFLKKSILITTDAIDSTYHNVVIPVGTAVTTQDADVKLVPSEWIETEDYDSYYDEYRF